MGLNQSLFANRICISQLMPSDYPTMTEEAYNVEFDRLMALAQKARDDGNIPFLICLERRFDELNAAAENLNYPLRARIGLRGVQLNEEGENNEP